MYETRFADRRVAGEYDFVGSFGIAAVQVVTADAHRSSGRRIMQHIVRVATRQT